MTDIFDLFFTVIMPVGLIVIMVGMGMSLDVQSFRQIFKTPRPAIAGICAQLLLLPALAFLLVFLFDVQGMVALGLILLSACPGGVTSNALTYIARGDVALSVSLTAVNSLAIIITLPIIFLLGSQLAGISSSVTVDVPVSLLMTQLAMITVLPIAAGMAIRRYLPGFAEACGTFIRLLTVILLTLIFVSLLISEYDFFMASLREVGGLVFTLMVLTMGLGYVLGTFLSLPEAQRFTILIEVGIQNTVIAVFIASNILDEKMLAVVPSTYGILMMFVVGLLMLCRRLVQLRPVALK